MINIVILKKDATVSNLNDDMSSSINLSMDRIFKKKYIKEDYEEVD